MAWSACSSPDSRKSADRAAPSPDTQRVASSGGTLGSAATRDSVTDRADQGRILGDSTASVWIVMRNRDRIAANLEILSNDLGVIVVVVDHQNWRKLRFTHDPLLFMRFRSFAANGARSVKGKAYAIVLPLTKSVGHAEPIDCSSRRSNDDAGLTEFHTPSYTNRTRHANVRADSRAKQSLGLTVSHRPDVRGTCIQREPARADRVSPADRNAHGNSRCECSGGVRNSRVSRPRHGARPANPGEGRKTEVRLRISERHRRASSIGPARSNSGQRLRANSAADLKPARRWRP